MSIIDDYKKYLDRVDIFENTACERKSCVDGCCCEYDSFPLCNYSGAEMIELAEFVLSAIRFWPPTKAHQEVS